MKTSLALIAAAALLSLPMPAQAGLGKDEFIGLARPMFKKGQPLSASQVAAMRMDKLGALSPTQSSQGGKGSVSQYYFMADLYYGNPLVWLEASVKPHEFA